MADNDRFPVKLFPTATATDVLFYVVQGPKLDRRGIPTYGTPYNDITPRVEDWPDHKLVFVSPPDGDGKQKWFFAADRQNQDEYNWSHSRVTVNGTQFDSISRTYITAREAYDPETPSVNDAMPNVPAGKFATGFVLHEKRQLPAPDDTFASLYVFEERTYLRHTGAQTKIRQRDSLIPEKFRAFTRIKVTTTLHNLSLAVIPIGDLLPEPDEFTTNVVKVELNKINDDQYSKTVTVETIDENAAALVGKRAYDEREVATTTEQVVADGTLAESGPLIVSSVVDPLGNGKSVKQTVSVSAWTEHIGKTWDDELQAHIVETEQFVGAPGTLPNTDYRIVNKDRVLKITKVIPTDALNNYVLSHLIQVSPDIPRVLKSVEVVWNEGKDVGQRYNDFASTVKGDSWTNSGDNSDSDSSSVSLMPEVLPEFEAVSADSFDGIGYSFFLPRASCTVAGIKAKLSTITGTTVLKWPIFKKRTHTIIGKGQSASVSVSTNASCTISWNNVEGVTKDSRQQGYGDNIGKNLSNSVTQIGPCIHGEILVSGQTSRSETVSAFATSPIYGSLQAPLTPTHSRTVTAQGSVYPTVLPATVPAALPTTGLYLLNTRIQPYAYDYVKIYAEVFDASQLA